MSINMNCLTWREYQIRLIQYQGMAQSRNDGTSFNVLGIDGGVTPTFVCTFSFVQIEKNIGKKGWSSEILRIFVTEMKVTLYSSNIVTI